VVVVMANISFADPKSISLGIAEAFSKQRYGGHGLQPVPGR
jgi:hypothetical protein